ncbi:MAG: hypothetical protein CMJ80_06380 [Planctomycetaceae bacterium]|nr:hypothetical protein [Planctomycetaceae bacterium]
MSSILCSVDDKSVPLYRILWVSEVPHFCGQDDCLYEGRYEIRLEQDESVWANRTERDNVVKTLESWQGGLGGNPDWEAP